MQGDFLLGTPSGAASKREGGSAVCQRLQSDTQDTLGLSFFLGQDGQKPRQGPNFSVSRDLMK